MRLQCVCRRGGSLCIVLCFCIEDLETLYCSCCLVVMLLQGNVNVWLGIVTMGWVLKVVFGMVLIALMMWRVLNANGCEDICACTAWCTCQGVQVFLLNLLSFLAFHKYHKVKRVLLKE